MTRFGGRPASKSTQVIAAVNRHDYSGWNKAMVGAFKKGAFAYLAGATQADCPYRDKRKPSGGLSWSRAFIHAWMDGWHLAHKTLTGSDHACDYANCQGHKDASERCVTEKWRVATIPNTLIHKCDAINCPGHVGPHGVCKKS